MSKTVLKTPDTAPTAPNTTPVMTSMESCSDNDAVSDCVGGGTRALEAPTEGKGMEIFSTRFEIIAKLGLPRPVAASHLIREGVVMVRRMHVCMYVYVCTYVWIYMHLYTCVRAYESICVCMYESMCVCRYVYTYVFMYVHVYARLYMYACMYTWAYAECMYTRGPLGSRKGSTLLSRSTDQNRRPVQSAKIFQKLFSSAGIADD